MAHGLDTEHELVIRWGWMPQAAWAVHRPLPPTVWQDDAAFLAIAPDPAERAAYSGSFPQLSQLSPDLRFYRLVRIFNTPIRSITTKEAGHAEYAYWGGVHQDLPDDHRWSHLWFFKDEHDGDDIVLEYTFARRLRLRSAKKAAAALAAFYTTICARLAQPLNPTGAKIPGYR